MRYLFGDFALDTDAYSLSKAGRAQRVRPKVFELLRFLIERRGRIVTKQDLLDALWGAQHVNEAVVPWSVNHARRVLGQRGRQKEPIETVYGRGYRWRATVEVLRDPDRRAEPASTARGDEAAREPIGLPFVGRAEPMADLRERLLRAQGGSGGLCLLVGEPGIGKTRCMDEFASSARDLGFSAWSGRASEDRWAPPFWPWIQVLRGAVNERGMRSDAGPLLTRLSTVGSEGEREASRDAQPQSARFLLIDAVAHFLLQASRRKPLLVLLDDLHWADTASIDLLAAIAPELSRHALLIVATQRNRSDEYRMRRPAQLVRYAERIELSPLTSSDVGEYIQLVTRSSESDVALSAAVHSATAGNALFLQETVRALIAQHGRSGLSSLSPSGVKPVQLARDVLRERIDVLDAAARNVLSTASVLGERFDANLLQTVCGVGMDALLTALDAGTRAGLIVTEGSNQYRFCHALMRSVLYDELPSRARMAAHRAAAKAIEPIARIVARHGELAHHHYRSLPLGDAKAAAAAARGAAEEAVRAGELGDAAMFCQWALESQPLDVHASPRERAELLLLRARSARHAGHDQDARTAVAQLIEVARQHGYADLLVRAARVLRPGRTWGTFADPMVRGALEETLRIRADEHDEQRISALSQLASVPPYALDMERSKALSSSALELARKLGKPSVLAEALRAQLYALSGPDDIDALLATAGEMLALDGDGASWISISAHSARYGAAVHRGDLAAADQALTALGRTARLQQRPEALWFHDRLRAQQHFLAGDSAGTESGFKQLQGVRLSTGSWLFRIPQTLLAIEREGAVAAAAHCDLSSLVSRTHEMHAEYRVGLARVAAEAGREDLARSALERLAPGDFAAIPKDISYLNTLANLALVAIALEDRPRAQRLYELLAPYPHHNSPSRLMYYQGSVSHFLALLAEFLGHDQRAAAHFEDALTMNERLGHGSQLARTYYEYARFLLGRGQGEHGRGQQLKARGTRLAASLGMNALEARARAL